MQKTFKIGYAIIDPDEEKPAPRSFDITIEVEGDIYHNLELVFDHLNDPDVLMELDERSMTVGDTVTVDGKMYLCMMDSWKDMADLKIPRAEGWLN